MDSFRAIGSFLGVVRARLCRREGARALLLALAAIAVLGVVLPLWAAHAAPEKARAAQRAALLLLGVASIAALAWGVFVPRRRTRDAAALARLVGVAEPAVASDLLSVVELERELEGSPRFSRELAMALADSTARRLEILDVDALVPRRPVRRAAAALGLGAAAQLVALLAAPAALAIGWSRLLHPPEVNARLAEATAVGEPIVGDIKLTLSYPRYTGRPPLVVPASTGDILALKGTQVALETTALQAVAGARLIFEGARESLPLAVDGRTLRGTLQVERPAQFRFFLAPPAGNPVVEAEPHRIEIEADRAPRVELVAPADELDVSSQRRVELAYNIDDDYGVAEITLVWRGPSGKDERKVVAKPGSRTAQAKFIWDLSEISLNPGSRVAYHLEAKDNDDVSGPNVGSSRTFYLRVFSPRQRHEELVERLQGVYEEAIRVLGDRLETAADDLDRHADVLGESQKLVMDLGALIGAVGQDTLAPKGLRAELEQVHGRLEKLIREQQPLMTELLQKRARTPSFLLPKTGPLADHDKKAVLELEKDILILDDWLSRQRMEELLAITDELKQHRQRLKDLMQQYERTHSDQIRAEIEREMRAIEQRIAELQQKMARLSGEVADRFVNSEAMQQADTEDCFAQVRAFMDKGDVRGAQRQLERCERMTEQMAESLEQGLHGLRRERFSEEEKAYNELLGEVADLEREQRAVAGEADDLMDRYKKRAAEAAKNKNNPAQKAARKTLDKLAKEVDKVPRDGLTPFSQEELDALKQRLSDVGKMLDEGDVAEALAMAKHAQEELRTIAGDIQDDMADGQPWSDRTPEAKDKVDKSMPLSQQLIEELQQATPSPEEMMSPQDRMRMQDLVKRQQQLRQRAQKLAEKAQKKGKELPGNSGEVAQKGLEQAGEQMGRAGERGQVPDPMGARDEATGAADKLSDLQKKMGKASRPSMVPGNGRDPDEEPVKIPGSEEYKPPEEFREDILDAMKKEKPPEAYKDQVKRYYEELVK